MARASLMLCWQALGLHGQSPLDVIKTSNQKVLAIFKSHEKIDPEAKEEIIRIINSVTDLDKISKNTIEKFCRDLTQKECEEFDRTFKELLRAASLNKLGRTRADRFEYLGEKIEGNTAVVKSIAYYRDESITLDYVLELQNGTWKIVNYIADEVDTIKNYRKQFTKLFAKDTFPGIMARLKKKIINLEEENEKNQDERK